MQVNSHYHGVYVCVSVYVGQSPVGSGDLAQEIAFVLLHMQQRNDAAPRNEQTGWCITLECVEQSRGKEKEKRT